MGIRPSLFFLAVGLSKLSNRRVLPQAKLKRTPQPVYIAQSAFLILRWATVLSPATGTKKREMGIRPSLFFLAVGLSRLSFGLIFACGENYSAHRKQPHNQERSSYLAVGDGSESGHEMGIRPSLFFLVVGLSRLSNRRVLPQAKLKRTPQPVYIA